MNRALLDVSPELVVSALADGNVIERCRVSHGLPAGTKLVHISLVYFNEFGGLIEDGLIRLVLEHDAFPSGVPVLRPMFTKESL